ncbi:TPA: hypothetical protein ACH0UR_005274, partial [Klebsiella pneumoniae]
VNNIYSNYITLDPDCYTVARARIPATPARFMQWFSCTCMIYAKARQFWRALAKTILKRSCDLMRHRHALQS